MWQGNSCRRNGRAYEVKFYEENRPNIFRVELLDPRYRIQKQNILDRSRGVSIASNDEISKNLQLFAKKRGDIFGKENELEAADEQEEKKDDKVIWDGHTGSIPATINAAISSAIEQQTKPKEDKEKVVSSYILWKFNFPSSQDPRVPLLPLLLLLHLLHLRLELHQSLLRYL